MWPLLAALLLSTISMCLCQSAQQQRLNTTTAQVEFQNDTMCGGIDSCRLPANAEKMIFRNEHTLDQYLMGSSVIYGLLAHTNELELTHLCRNQLHTLHESIHKRDTWAMKMLDSSASSQPGFVLGNNFWLGSMKGCEAVQTPKRITLSARFTRNMKPGLLTARAPFDVDYRMVYAKHNSAWQIQVEFLLSEKILHMGLCLPVSCSNVEIMNLTQAYLDSNLMQPQHLFEHQPHVLHVKHLKVKPEFFQKTSIKIIGVFLLFTIGMVVLAALWVNDKESSNYVKNTSIPNINIHKNNDNNNNNTNNNNYNDELSIPKQNIATVSIKEYNFITKSSQPENATDRHILQRVVRCFSLSNNAKYILCTKSSPNAVPTINAFKSIGCFLIMNFHVIWYSHFAVHNPAIVFALGEQFHWQWVSTSPIIVDIFFAISGLLLAYNFRRNAKRIAEIQQNALWQNVKLFGKQFLHRYLRLSPLYLVVIGIMEISTSYMVDTSPFWIQERCDQMCQRYWWRNVLYIQNMFEVTELCLNWTWSMACEMQFFCLFTVLLFASTKYEILAKRIFATMFYGFIGLVFYIAWQTKFTPAYDVMHDLGADLYTSPWTRILPYMMGIGFGWQLYQSKGVMPFNKKMINLLWTLSATIMLVSHLATINRDISHHFAAPIIAGVRVFYSGSAAWMIVASALGHGGCFTSFMSCKVFVHLNKLSYAIYLLNPMVISVVYGLTDHTTHFDPITQIVTSIGIMVIVYVLAFVFSLLFEVPYTNLSNVLLHRRKEKPV